eukprot:CAMPEP_0202728836 /NCGR_PEP_ID=MMETSP1385-20130828/185829_1 /ASSEMBLY_ACC=CAM_ASM_000861 /TAXON_ID=933848 /ORGANISM="Elphidium margaritaceum" /LENGTH=463 /DNA_ID=CAMNT_0049395089 /DNA_START=189 /DNA_END=1577 /DNA_ORIENTATION=+
MLVLFLIIVMVYVHLFTTRYHYPEPYDVHPIAYTFDEHNEEYLAYKWLVFGAFVGIPYFYVKKGHLSDRRNVAENDLETHLNIVSIATICDSHALHDAHEMAASYADSGPLSVAVFIDSDYRTHTYRDHTELILSFASHFEDVVNNYDISVGILYINTSSPTWQQRNFYSTTPMMLKFPTNALRNLAEHQINTRWLLNLDIDFYHLSRSLHNLNLNQSALNLDIDFYHLSRSLHNLNLNQSALNQLTQRYQTHQETIFIIPAFEVQSQQRITATDTHDDDDADVHAGDAAPIDFNALDKDALLRLIESKTVAPFHASMQAQRCTDYERWYRSVASYVLDYTKHSECSWPYEPWYIIRSEVSRMPQYQWDNDFIGRGLNKVERTFTLRHYCFTFVVMHELFIIHPISLHHTKHFTQKDKLNWHRFNLQLFEEKRNRYFSDPRSCTHLPYHDPVCQSGKTSSVGW